MVVVIAFMVMRDDANLAVSAVIVNIAFLGGLRTRSDDQTNHP